MVIDNGKVELVVLPGGGHIASLRLSGDGQPNLLWEAPWKTIEPHRFSGRQDERKYGSEMVGRFLSGYTGHAVCLDYFGAPSPAEAAAGLPLHGELASRRWRMAAAGGPRGTAKLRMTARAPLSGFDFERTVALYQGESVVYFRERLTNLRRTGRAYQWVEHAAFGPPLLEREESAVGIPATRARSWPLGYEGKSLLAESRDSLWPQAFTPAGALVDVSRPFTTTATGFVIAALIDPAREHGFVAALNWRLGLVAGYIFRRRDFPWVAIWEENCARTYPPWNGITRVRGMEFGNTAMPLGLSAAMLDGPMFGQTVVSWLDALAAREIGYLAFAAEVPRSWRGVEDVRLDSNQITVIGSRKREQVRLPARGLREAGLVGGKTKTTER